MTVEKKSIRLARLSILKADKVYDELMKYHEELLALSLSLDWIYEHDKDLEKALLRRNEPLIDLGLAIVAHSPEIINSLWEKYDGQDETLSLGIKVGILGGTNVNALSNDVLAKILEGYYITGVDDGDEMARTLLNNKRARWMIADFLIQKMPFNNIPPARFSMLLHTFRKNPCLNIDRSDSYSPDFIYWNIRKGIREALIQAPATTDWLSTLTDLLPYIEEQYSIENPNEFDFKEFLVKWRAMPDDGRSPRDGYYTNQTLTEETLCLFASLFGYKEFNRAGVELTEKEESDVVYRCAYYSRAYLSKKQVIKAIERDGSVFILSALFNDRLLLKSDYLELIKNEIDDNLMHLFEKRIQRLKNKNSWFKPPLIDSPKFNRDENHNLLKESVDALKALIAQQSTSINFLKYCFLGVLIISVFRHYV